MTLTRLRRQNWPSRLLTGGWLFLLVVLPLAHNHLHQAGCDETRPTIAVATAEPAPFCLLCQLQRLPAHTPAALTVTSTQVAIASVTPVCRHHTAPPPGHRSGRSPPPLA